MKKWLDNSPPEGECPIFNMYGYINAKNNKNKIKIKK